MFMRKYRKRILFCVAAIVFSPILVCLLLWWDSRPKEPPDVAVHSVKVVSRGESKSVTL